MIDIIIPVYNSGRTICKTLNSILDQENYEDLVVYLIDDCSDEDYSDIIKHFSKYLTIKYYRLKENSGPGVARQYGLEQSKNEYIVFIDSDDMFYEHDSILKLYNSIYDFDMSFGKMLEKGYNYSLESHHEGCLHGKMFRRSFIVDNNLRFSDYRNHEDNAFDELYLSLSKKVNFIDDIIYIYNHNNNNSLSLSLNTADSLKTYIRSMTWLFNEIEKRDNIDSYKVGLLIMKIFCYCYFNYLLDENLNEFVFNDLNYLKKMYLKYIDSIDDEDKLALYKNFDYQVIPSITLDDFIEKIHE